ncbi:class I SAM-dependent methyltransferase [bacterium]|jgi:tellurite methyltransferase|nr:class I SAM-dependent methyltransferase [bacterium]
MDKKYWNDYYRKHNKDGSISTHSSFAEFCLSKFFIANNLDIVELGSGNGRDAIYFAHHLHNVVAIDQSTTAIDIEKESLRGEVAQYLQPKALDFIDEDYSKYESIDVLYSRFTIHAISKSDEEELLPNVYSGLNDGGLFCVEVRTTKDSLYGVGENCGHNTFITDHKRRFIDSQVFVKQCLTLGFKILYFSEENNLSVYKNDNPVLMRLILQK